MTKMRHTDYRVRVLVDGVPTEGRTGQVALNLLAIAELAKRVSLGVANDDGSVTPLPLDQVDWDAGVLVLQNAGAQTDSVRGALRDVASIVHGREEAVRAERAYQEQSRRRAAEAKRQADAVREATDEGTR